jgi:DNA processing protein
METVDWLRLYRSEGIGPAGFFQLLERCGSAAGALAALPDLARRKIQVFPRDQAEAELAALDKLGGRLLLAKDPDFPSALRGSDIVPLLSVRGDATLLARPGLAIVGAREASAAGRKIAFTLAQELSAQGFVIISGMARGIDSAAHRGSLTGGTVAILAGGVDVIYPPQNHDLYRALVDQGAVVSEMPPGFQPQAKHFPRRNRLISGLAVGVVVVEAALRSGSLVTARYAAEQGREVFAVPGSPLEARSQGPNSLIKQGAVLVENARDIIDALPAFQMPYRVPPANAAPPIGDKALSEAHLSVTKALTVTAVTVDEILRQCQLSPSTLSLVLLELELAGRLIRHPDQTVALRT